MLQPPKALATRLSDSRSSVVIDQLRASLEVASIHLTTAAMIVRMLGSEADARIFDDAAEKVRGDLKLYR